MILGNAAKEVTISVGVSFVKPTELIEPDELVNRADKALYRAKKSGRNRVETIEDNN